LTFFSRFTPDGGAKYQARLRDSRVGIVGNGYLAKTLQRQLKESGFGEVITLDRDAFLAEHEQQTLPALFFVAQEAEDPQVLDAMNRLSKQRKIPWLLVRAVEANVGWVGPLFIPGETACYESLDARLRSNLSYFPEYQAFTNYLRDKRQASADCGSLHVFFDLLGAIAVIEAIKFLGNVTVPQLAGRFLTINLTTWDVETHDVLRVPSLGLEVTEPKLFAWKEMPAESIINDEGSIYSRRS
jgi:bacteriocin biosynthesis cyclodehydratase domain-containing protein